VRKNRDAHVGHRNDIGRRSGRLLARVLDSGERLIIVGNDDAGAEGAHDEEETETPVDGLEGVLDVDARALGFGCHHGDVLGSNDTEGLKISKSQHFFLRITSTRSTTPSSKGEILRPTRALRAILRIDPGRQWKGILRRRLGCSSA